MSTTICMHQANRSGISTCGANNSELKVSNLDEKSTFNESNAKPGLMCMPKTATGRKTDANSINSKIFFLDGSEKHFKIHTNYPARYLLEKCCRYLRINEIDIFGLYFRDLKNRKIWLNMSQPLNKQIKTTDSSGWIFVFRVKFYPSDIGHISDDITRYYLTLQVRNDLITQRLQASINMCVAMAAYIVQSEIGDYSEDQHGTGIKYIQDFNFIPNQTNDFLEKVSIAHKTLRGFEPTEADAKLLSFAMKLSLYGQHTQQVVDKTDNSELTLAVNYSGVTIYAKNLICHFFPWQMITKIHANSKLFHIEAKCDLVSTRKKVYVYRMADERVNDAFLNLVIEHHIFFRLKDPKQDTVYGTGMSFGNRNSYSYNGSTIHRKCSEKSSNNNDIKPRGNLSYHESHHSTPMKEQTSKTDSRSIGKIKELPISVEPGCDSFDLRKFDTDTLKGIKPPAFEDQGDTGSALSQNERLFNSMNQNDSGAEKLSEKLQYRTRTLSIHTQSIEDDTDDKKVNCSGQHQHNNYPQNDVTTIPIDVEASDESQSEFTGVIADNLKGFTQVRVDGVEMDG